jgi:hypothetical protein
MPTSVLDQESNDTVGYKHTGVCKYVCFGGKLGKPGGRLRSVAGISAVVPSSSEGSSLGDGERERGGTRMGKLGVRFELFAAPFIFLAAVLSVGMCFSFGGGGRTFL